MTIDYPLVDVVKVKPMEAFRLWVRFSDGREGVADLSGLVARAGSMVAPLRDPAYFNRVFVEAGVPTWPNGYDYAPSALYVEMRDFGRSLIRRRRMTLFQCPKTPLPVGRGAGVREPAAGA